MFTWLEYVDCCSVRNIEELTQYVNRCEVQINDLYDEAEELRERLGLDPKEPINIEGIRQRKSIKIERDRALNRVLQKEVCTQLYYYSDYTVWCHTFVGWMPCFIGTWYFPLYHRRQQIMRGMRDDAMWANFKGKFYLCLQGNDRVKTLMLTYPAFVWNSFFCYCSIKNETDIILDASFNLLMFLIL